MPPNVTLIGGGVVSKRYMSALVCVVIALGVSSCGLVRQAKIQAEQTRLQAAIQADPYSHYYTPVQLSPEVLSRRESNNGELIVEPGGKDVVADSLAMIQSSYVLIGQTSFNASEQCWDIQKAKNLGSRIQADKALYYRIYTDTETGQHSYLEPTKQTTQTYVKGLGYVDSTTTQNNVMTSSYSVRNFDITVTYWAKYRPVLGVLCEDLTPEQCRLIGSNKGASVKIICKRSPAFDADILPGDIITNVNGRPVATMEDLTQIINSSTGQKIRIEIVRSGNGIQKEVRLNE